MFRHELDVLAVRISDFVLGLVVHTQFGSPHTVLSFVVIHGRHRTLVIFLNAFPSFSSSYGSGYRRLESPKNLAIPPMCGQERYSVTTGTQGCCTGSNTGVVDRMLSLVVGLSDAIFTSQIWRCCTASDLPL